MDYVWGSNTITQFEPGFGLLFEWDGEHPAAEDDTTLRIRKGERVDPGALPVRCVLSGTGKRARVPDFFFLNYYILSESMARIFREFDLGHGYLHPLQLMDRDGTTVLGTYYILVAGNVKSALVPEKSENLKKDAISRLKLPVIPKNDALVMSRDALEGPDVWHHQPFLKGLFLSDRLVRTLKSQKCDRLFHLYRIRIE
ncbi:hypothetical protein KPG71_02615 [Roseovarius sp. PS-C2]|uniref:imm11 family protein n=1 Tax=Roseovarius sp. PS-C2 TaxID=2820814 RepID=UPI001C0C5887|nr:hypothetical protein [Roseovarius sp. PS-C2]MBU3258901.1 hypothetical protein [Roseovarius sp. PS-C2]